MPLPDVEVVHRDEHLLVLLKPSGLPTTAPRGEASLALLARELDPGAPRLHPTSRLDAEVTGLVVFARTRRANHVLLGARRRGGYHRLYLALSSGEARPPRGRWTHAIGVDPRDRRRRVAVVDPERPRGALGVRPACTEYETVATAVGVWLLALRPRTGRTHQLRVHAQAAGLPLVGDVHYGGPRRVVRADGRVVTARRTMLHCARVRIPTPAGDELALEAGVPEDMQLVWTGCGGSAGALDLG